MYMDYSQELELNDQMAVIQLHMSCLSGGRMANDKHMLGAGMIVVELELELTQTQITQKPMLRSEVYARALRASQNRK